MEKQARFQAFVENYEYILQENAKGHSYTLGLTDFSDMSTEEFEKSHFGMRKPKKPSSVSRKMHQVRNISLPGSVDWRSKGVVTAVKNQELLETSKQGAPFVFLEIFFWVVAYLNGFGVALAFFHFLSIVPIFVSPVFVIDRLSLLYFHPVSCTMTSFWQLAISRITNTKFPLL